MVASSSGEFVERQDQPRFGHGEHIGPDLGDRLGAEEDTEVPRAQQAEGLGDLEHSD